MKYLFFIVFFDVKLTFVAVLSFFLGRKRSGGNRLHF